MLTDHWYYVHIRIQYYTHGMPVLAFKQGHINLVSTLRLLAINIFIWETFCLRLINFVLSTSLVKHWKHQIPENCMLKETY